MGKLRDKITGRLQKEAQDQCAMAPQCHVMSEPQIVAAAMLVANLQGADSALRNRLQDLENDYEHTDKELNKIREQLDKARVELSRLM